MVAWALVVLFVVTAFFFLLALVPADAFESGAVGRQSDFGAPAESTRADESSIEPQVVLDSADDELLLNAFEPATISEVGTKLDLARAYIDMGDPDGARSILLEVLQEGSVTQKQEAQRLVEALPG